MSLLQPVTSVMATITPLQPGCLPTWYSSRARLTATPHEHSSNGEVEDHSSAPRQILDQELFASVMSLLPSLEDDDGES